MMKVAIGTLNRAKIEAVKKGFSEMHVEYVAVNAASNVSAQPFSDDETLEGAINRAKNGLIEASATIGIGLEGGVVDTRLGLFLCNWGALVDNQSNLYVASGAKILLPNEVAKEVKAGKELGEVMDRFTNLQQVSKNQGAIGIFTNGMVDRSEMFAHIVKLLIGQFSYKMNVLEESKRMKGKQDY